MPDGKSMIQHVVDRALQVNGVDEVVLAVPIGEHADFCNCGVGVIEGPEDDVLGRVRCAAFVTGADVVGRITGDCPFLDPRVCERVLERFHADHADFATNDTRISGYPDGHDCEVCSRALLERLDRDVTSAYDREHVFAAVHGMKDINYVLVTPPEGVTYPSEKLSIDSVEDLERLTRPEVGEF